MTQASDVWSVRNIRTRRDYTNLRLGISRRTDTDTGKDQTRRCRGEEYAFGVIFSLSGSTNYSEAQILLRSRTSSPLLAILCT
jgi:hypothetical protein